MNNGCNGKILRVNLSSSDISVEEPEEDFYRTYFGGWGFVAYYLLKEVPPEVEPLAPENKLIFALGPVTGVPIAGSARNAVGAKSPLTSLFGEGDVGGWWNAELKRAGYDAIIVEGKAEKPVYLWVHDGEFVLDSIWK
jgi:aldehyde:ferredoxin oxidoreductase